MTYKFVEFTPELRLKIEKIIQKEIHSVRLAPENEKNLNDMVFEEGTGGFIN